MPPRAKYPAPHKQLGELMLAARRRGLDFEEFWQEAIRPGRSMVMVNDADPPDGAVRWPTDPKDRSAWRQGIIEAKDGWRRAYERAEPTGAEVALGQLADLLDELDVLIGLDAAA